MEHSTVLPNIQRTTAKSPLNFRKLMFAQECVCLLKMTIAEETVEGRKWRWVRRFEH